MEEMFENLWIVDKRSYETCVIDTTQAQNRIVMKCDTPLELRFYTIVFQQFSANPDGLEFEPGNNYYFIGKVTVCFVTYEILICFFYFSIPERKSKNICAVQNFGEIRMQMYGTFCQH